MNAIEDWVFDNLGKLLIVGMVLCIVGFFAIGNSIQSACDERRGEYLACLEAGKQPAYCMAATRYDACNKHSGASVVPVPMVVPR